MTALGLAANIVQFIDFTRSLLSDAKEIYHSTTGTTAEYANLEEIAEQLSFFGAKLESSRSSTDNAPSQGTVGAQIGQIAMSCKSIADEILDCLQPLKAQDSGRKKWKSFLHALQSLWKRERIRRLQERLKSMRDQALFQMVSEIRSARCALFQSNHRRIS